MAEAVAKLDLDATGFKRGADQVVTDANRIMQADGNLRAQLNQSRVFGSFGTGGKEKKKELEDLLEGERKLKNNVNQVAVALLQSGSAADILSTSLVRVAESFKIGLGGAIVAVVGEQIYEAFKKAQDAAEELEEKTESMGRKLKQNPAYASASVLNQNLADTQGAVDADQAAARKQAQAGFFASIGKGGTDTMRGLFGGLSKEELLAANKRAFTGAPGKGILGEIAGGIQEKDQAGVDERAKQLDEAKKQVGEKEAEQTEMQKMLVEGKREEAALTKINLEYNEKLGAAYRAHNVYLAQEIKKQKELAETAAKRSAQGESWDRGLRVSGSDIGETEARLALGRSTEDQKRGNLSAELAMARGNSEVASARAGEAPGDKDLQAAAAVAANSAMIAQHNLDKFNQDADQAREKQATLLELQLKAMDLQIQGQGKLAELIKGNAAAEIAAQEYLRNTGDTAGANKIRTNRLRQVQDGEFEDALDGKTGRLRSQHSRLSEAQKNARGVRNRARDLKRFQDTGGLLNVHRDSSGHVANGIDPVTGQRMTPAQKAAQQGAGLNLDKNAKEYPGAKEMMAIATGINTLVGIVTTWK